MSESMFSYSLAWPFDLKEDATAAVALLREAAEEGLAEDFDGKTMTVGARAISQGFSCQARRGGGDCVGVSPCHPSPPCEDAADLT